MEYGLLFKCCLLFYWHFLNLSVKNHLKSLELVWFFERNIWCFQKTIESNCQTKISFFISSIKKRVVPLNKESQFRFEITRKKNTYLTLIRAIILRLKNKGNVVCAFTASRRDQRLICNCSKWVGFINITARYTNGSYYHFSSNISLSKVVIVVNIAIVISVAFIFKADHYSSSFWASDSI